MKKNKMCRKYVGNMQPRPIILLVCPFISIFLCFISVSLTLFSCKNASNTNHYNLEASENLKDSVGETENDLLKRITIGIDESDAEETTNTNDNSNAATSETINIEPPYDSIDNDNKTTTIYEDINISRNNRKKSLLDVDYHTDEPIISKKLYLESDYHFATYSQINEGFATIYIVNKKVATNFKNKIVAVNAGHGTVGGTRKKTYSHPDYSPKVAGGTNKAGAVFSVAVSDGTVLLDGKQEATANLMVAVALKEKLLSEGYSVLMVREDKNCRLDNIARTVIANENADIHIAIHFDSTERDKGIFYMKPINNKFYLDMDPLKYNVDNINNLGKCLIDAFKEIGEKVWKGTGYLEGDLTQIAFSTNASVDIELGDRATFLDEARAKTFAEGLFIGIEKYFALTPEN